MKVLFITNIPSPYRLRFFETLGKSCELTVLFERVSSNERDASWLQTEFLHFKGIFLKGIKLGVDKAFSWDVIRYLKQHFDVIFVTDFLSPTGMLATWYMKKRGIPYILESDGGFVGQEGWLKKAIKTGAIRGAFAYFSTGTVHDEYYLAYGAERARLVRYPFSSVVAEKVLRRPLTCEEKFSIRERLGIKEKKVILYVGQFIHRKGVDVLLKAYQHSKQAEGLYLIGGTPTEEYQRIVEERHLANVHYIGFKKPEVIAEYYKAADVFVLPTRYDIWGLVVNEALAYGLPVVTTRRCLAGLEMVEKKGTGLLCKAENIDELASCIDEVLLNGQEAYSAQCLTIASQYSIEAMVQKHLDFINQYLQK